MHPTPSSINGDVLPKYSTMSQPGSRHWYNPPTLFRSHQFHIHSFGFVYIFDFNFTTFVDSCEHQHSQDANSSIMRTPCPTSYSQNQNLLFLHQSLVTTNLVSISVILSFKNVIQRKSYSRYPFGISFPHSV